MKYDVIIVGGGPGGLACALSSAAAGLKTLVLERKSQIGPKVCAGGITWNGLLRTVSADLAERSFPIQHLNTPMQRASIHSPTPIIATVNRLELGKAMAEQAMAMGAEIREGCRVCAIEESALVCEEVKSGRRERLSAGFIVGADGSSSLVRRYLGLGTTDVGIGINYQIPGEYPQMEWHLDSSRFGSGYAWVFPHKSSASVGAYVDARCMSAQKLKNNFLHWAEGRGYPLQRYRASADLINFDYRGHRFGKIFLVGDAAGMASGLTGEGIYSAITSGEAVANILAGKSHGEERLTRLLRNHRRHRNMVTVLNRHRLLPAFLGEVVTLALRMGIITFDAVEMAH